MSITIALAGNPNCGKTTVFNELTGSKQYVGNWPGVTVEKKGGKAKGYEDVDIIDLPGIYSLSPYSLEEVVTRNFLIEGNVDVIINIVDGSNLERNLYLTTQLKELGIPIVIALNMMDVVKSNGDTVYVSKLSEALECDVVETTAAKGKGLEGVLESAVKAAKSGSPISKRRDYGIEAEKALTEIETMIPKSISPEKRRFYAIKLFERDEKFQEQFSLNRKDVEGSILNCERDLNDDAESIIANLRYQWIEDICKTCSKKKDNGINSVSDKIDKILTNKFLALPLFCVIMWGIYYISIQTLGSVANGWVETFFQNVISVNVSNFLVAVGAASWLQGLIIDGIIAGVGGVLTFVPQLMILFFFLSFLEDCGYMMRVAFIMDRVFRKFGMSGKSFIPMLVGTGCTVPGIMATKTIESERDRKMTIMLTPFIPCGAKLPVFALFVGAFFPKQSWVGPSMYLLGIAAVILSGIILKGTHLFQGEKTHFVMELPKYKLPQLKSVLMNMWEKGREFIIKAGTIIFVASGCIWFLQSFNWSLEMVDTGESILAGIGKVISPIFSPLGFGNWQASVAIITGLLAKETIVATFGILLGGSTGITSDVELINGIGQIFTQVSAYAFMTFVLLSSPCFAAIAAIRREMNSWKWTAITLVYQTGFAYVAAMLIYQIGSRIL